ncbi:MAG: hypothetical protein ACFE0Q_14860 [Anaerolineae bacterium]
MEIGFSLFSVFIAPLVLLGVWGMLLWRWRDPILTALTLALVALIALTAGNIALTVARNPYLMLWALTALTFNLWALPRANDDDRRYLMLGNVVVLVMLGALHGWHMYLRQSAVNWSAMLSALISIWSVLVLLSAVVRLPWRY